MGGTHTFLSDVFARATLCVESVARVERRGGSAHFFCFVHIVLAGSASRMARSPDAWEEDVDQLPQWRGAGSPAEIEDRATRVEESRQARGSIRISGGGFSRVWIRGRGYSKHHRPLAVSLPGAPPVTAAFGVYSRIPSLLRNRYCCAGIRRGSEVVSRSPTRFGRRWSAGREYPRSGAGVAFIECEFCGSEVAWGNRKCLRSGRYFRERFEPG